MTESTNSTSLGAATGGRDAASEARATVLEATRRFFDVAHAPRPFVAGQTYIPVTAKVLDVADLVHLVDASLDLWLTSGRYGRDLEAALPARMQRQGNALLVNSGSSANLVAISTLGSPMLREFDRQPLEK